MIRLEGRREEWAKTKTKRMMGVMKLDEDWMEDVIRLENLRKTWQDDDKAKTRRR